MPGFNIYRAGADGVFVKINAEIIPAQGTSASGAAYQFVDSSVQNRQTYSYKLEDVDLNGTATQHGPVHGNPAVHLFIQIRRQGITAGWSFMCLHHHINR